MGFAEISGLVRSAVSFATQRCVNPQNIATIDEKALREIRVRMAAASRLISHAPKVTMTDFLEALKEVLPAFGADNSEVGTSECLVRIAAHRTFSSTRRASTAL